jgi:hypothetical protein
MAATSKGDQINLVSKSKKRETDPANSQYRADNRRYTLSMRRRKAACGRPSHGGAAYAGLGQPTVSAQLMPASAWVVLR